MRNPIRLTCPCGLAAILVSFCCSNCQATLICGYCQSRIMVNQKSQVEVPPDEQEKDTPSEWDRTAWWMGQD